MAPKNHYCNILNHSNSQHLWQSLYLIYPLIVLNNEKQKINLKIHNEEYPKNKRTETGFELELKGKKRQYVAVINEKGEKEVWVNFFCDDWGNDNWESDILIVHDGGNCYFNLKVNLTNKSYSELGINGYA